MDYNRHKYPMPYGFGKKVCKGPMSESEIQRAKKLKEEDGLLQKEIVRELGRSNSVISRVLNQ